MKEERKNFGERIRSWCLLPRFSRQLAFADEQRDKKHLRLQSLFLYEEITCIPLKSYLHSAELLPQNSFFF